MKIRPLTHLALAGLLAIALIASASAADKPNVVLMLSDNMG